MFVIHGYTIIPSHVTVGFTLTVAWIEVRSNRTIYIPRHAYAYVPRAIDDAVSIVFTKGRCDGGCCR